MTSRPFADSVVDYAQAGWPCILPVPPTEKTPPPVGFTGAAGRDTTPMDLVLWATSHAESSVALRMPENVIGIDVDQYVKGEVQKNGLQTLREAEERWGQLPATWSSTARGTNQGPGPSRIMFFRVPAQRYATKLTGKATGDVEVIQRHHRYAVVWPSANPQAPGSPQYRWYDPAGLPSATVPKVDEFPELPPAWVAGLAEGATEAGPAAADVGSGQVLLEQLLADTRLECADITSARLQAAGELERADAGSRHDTMTGRVHHLVQLAAAGHTGAGGALEYLRQVWATLTAGEDREGEFDRMLLTSARKAVTTVGVHQVPRDPCTLAQGFAVPAPHPSDDRPGAEEPDAIEPARWWSVREVIGAHAFDPRADLDQTLAEAVLERTYPALRYAYDADTWLLRVPERWETRKDLAGWAVSEVATLMPHGSTAAPKDSDDYARASRRTRLLSAKGAGAVAGKMKTLVVSGTHPVALQLGRLDADPNVLWAGGLPWDLRRSRDGLVVAEIDPATPHLHSAGVVPEIRPTPLWDAFLAALWPEEELRRWALRVLSICLTGYADRALPILLGETGRGKTQVVTLLMSVLGSYAHAANPKLLSAQSSSHDTIVYALKGRRLSFIDEAPREAKTGQERLKQLTGGGELTANEMHKDTISFRPTHTLVLTADTDPVLTDPAVRARVRLIPCEGDPDQVSGARAAIGNLNGPAWRNEAPGVLASMIREAAGWLATPATASTAAAPDGVRFRAEELAAEQDPIRNWVDNETEPYPPGTQARQLYQAFRGSCEQSGVRRDAIPNETVWGRALTRLGYPSQPTRSGKVRQLRIRPVGWGGDQFGPFGDQFVTSSEATGHTTKREVNPRFDTSGDQCDQFTDGITHTHAPAHTHTHAGGPETRKPVNWSPEASETAVDLRKRETATGHTDEPIPGIETEAVRAAAGQSEVPLTPAKQRLAEARAAKKLAAIEAAAGPRVQLPALVRPDGDVHAVSAEQADQLLATLTELTVDVEHTGFPVGHADYALRTVQLGNEAFAFVLDPDDQDQADVVRRHLERAEILHAHSATADLVPLAAAGLLGDVDAAWTKMRDTVIPAKLADPEMTESNDDLKGLARAVLRDRAVSPAAEEARSALFKAGKWLTDTKVTTAVERSGWAQVDSSCTTMIRYAASDVLDDAALARHLPQPPPEILGRELVAQRLTARVAHVGLRIDGEHVGRLLPPQREALTDAGGRLQAFGVDNPGSDQQVGTVAEQLGAQLPRTKTGRPSVAKGALEQYAKLDGPLGDFVRARLDYQKAETALGLFLEPYLQLVQRGDGRARPTVYTLSADTGRMSCVRPNLQQVPRQGGFRACITADPGELLASADFAGVELRVAAALSQDRNLMAILADPERDIHMEIAQLAWGAAAGKAERYKAKPMVFGRLYGSGVEGLARSNGVSEQVARAVIDAMDHLTPQLSEWSRQVRDAVKSGRTQFPTYSGRIVHLPPAWPHKAPNYCIQGTARELLIDALVKWEQTPWGRSVLLPVHDEIVVKVPEDEAEEATAALVECMATDLHGVRIVAEAAEPSFAWKDAA